MTTTKVKAAEALYPLLSAFHEVNGLLLKAVRREVVDDLFVGLVLDFESKALMIKADPDDDTLDFWVTNSSAQDWKEATEVSSTHPWREFIGTEFGWGWVSVNQQGYLDGLVWSFGGILPQLLVTVVASSLKVLDVTATA
ncbi:DUF6334 family protein [Terriglobus sp. RCC_193]|uniref:DUF6334 family protein n=1 Tax=Terriglobus sp. RCC_193 TaxID=3239218 RepID=UPI0035234541